MFYGIPFRMRNKEGKTIHGAVGFVGGMIKCMKIINPTHVIVVFDGPGCNNRKSLYQGYKGNRKKSKVVSGEDNPIEQIPEIERMLRYMSIQYTSIDGTEADDVIASYTIRYRHEMEIVILSTDKDFFQLVGPNVQVYSYKAHQSKIYDQKKIHEEYDLEPWQLVDYYALVGNPSDNIRGLPRIGAELARELIKEYHTVAELIEHCETAADKAVERVIAKKRKRILMNHRLITLDSKVSDLMGLNHLKCEIELLPPMNKIIEEVEDDIKE